MFFGKNKNIEDFNNKISGPSDQSYWSLVKKQFRKNRLAVWSLRILYGLVFLAIFGGLIANEKPLYCKIEGQTYYPAFREYLVDFGFAQWDAKFINNNWSSQNYESVVYPLIPYSAKTLDLDNTSKSPMKKQNVESKRFHHWFGTDHLGRDILAGMIQGVRIALSVGIISMGVATIFGLFFGGLAGFFGDDQIQVSRSQLILNILGFILGIFYGFGTRSFAITEGHFGKEILISILIFCIILFFANFLSKGIDRLLTPSKKIALPIDIIVMRLIETINSIPGIIFLLAILAVIESASIINVMIIIGLIGWTGIARFIRSELLRVRALDYIEAARSLGFQDLRILWRHALPNALTPVLITIAFGIAGAILVEATLSFLGIGMPVEEITWGKMLNTARGNINAWWLALFPGLAIFITVTIFNLIGEGLTDALNPKLKK